MNEDQITRIKKNLGLLIKSMSLTSEFLLKFRNSSASPTESEIPQSILETSTPEEKQAACFFALILECPDADIYDTLLTALKETRQVVPYNILSGAGAVDYIWRPTAHQLFKLPIDCPKQFHALITYLTDIGSADLLLSRDFRKATLLQTSISRMDVKEESILLFRKFGIRLNDPDICDRTALLYAIEGGRKKDYLQMLVRLGADFNVVDVEGNNALHYCVWKFNSELIDFFLSLGVRSRANKYGDTPLLLAVRDGDVGIKQEFNCIKSLSRMRCEPLPMESCPDSPYLYH